MMVWDRLIKRGYFCSEKNVEFDTYIVVIVSSRKREKISFSGEIKVQTRIICIWMFHRAEKKEANNDESSLMMLFNYKWNNKSLLCAISWIVDKHIVQPYDDFYLSSLIRDSPDRPSYLIVYPALIDRYLIRSAIRLSTLPLPQQHAIIPIISKTSSSKKKKEKKEKTR